MPPVKMECLMMKVTKLADYGLVIMAKMAETPGSQQTAGGLALATGLAKPTTTKILKFLTKAALLKATRGKAGGYVLSKSPENTSVLDVIEAVDGKVGMTDCVFEDRPCKKEINCKAGGNLRVLSAAISQTLASVSIAALTGSHRLIVNPPSISLEKV